MQFLGGPGSAGILVINKDLYPSSLPPTVGVSLCILQEDLGLAPIQ